MSGPKDYDLILTVERIASITQRLNDYRQTRAAQVRTALDRVRQSTRAQFAAEQSTARAMQQQALQQGRMRADAIRAEALRLAEESLNPASHPAPIVEVNLDRQPEALVDSSTLTTAIDEQLQTLTGWKDIVATDSAIASFRQRQASEWRVKTEKFLSDNSVGEADAASSAAAQSLLREAEKLHSEAGDLQGKFDTRNELLRDVMDSLKEIGFFVADPVYENPEDPLGAVLVKATRGGEEMAASIDLSKSVRSIWNGIAQEQCQDAFFDYIDQMQAKGVKVHAHRDDLQARPTLKQKGAQELPRSAKNQLGR